MKTRIFLLLTIVIFCFQIGFSIFYSINIVDQNSLININSTKYTELNQKNQDLENLLATFRSLKYLFPTIKNSQTLPVVNTININN